MITTTEFIRNDPGLNCFQLSEIIENSKMIYLTFGAIQIDPFDATEMDIAPVELLGWIIDRHAIGPVQILLDEHFDVRSIHPGALQPINNSINIS